MSSWLVDLKFAARGLRKQPFVTALVLLVLALGVAATVCVFSVVSTLVLNPFDFEEPERLVDLRGTSPSRGWPEVATSLPDFEDFRQQSETLEDLAAHSPQELNLSGEGEPERISGQRITANLFSVLGVRLSRGREFTVEETRSDLERLVILSDSLWRRRLNADPSVLGRTIRLDDQAYTIVGITPEGFHYPTSDTDVWVPLGLDPAHEGRANRRLTVVGRLAPGASLQQARTDLAAIARRLEQAYPDTNQGFETLVRPLREAIYGEEFARTWTVMLAAAFCLLLIACSNVASLLLARATVRSSELSLRVALGAERKQLMRSLFAESFLLSMGAALLAVLFSVWGIQLLVAILPADLPGVAEVGLDGPALAVALGLGLLTSVLCGVLPAWRHSRPDVGDVLKESGRSHSGRKGQWVRSGFVVAEIALAFVLLVTAGLLTKSLHELQSVDRGFDPEGVLSARLSLSSTKYDSPEKIHLFFDELRRKLENLPGVVSVGAVNELPTESAINWVTAFTVEGREPPAPGQEPVANSRISLPGYFKTLGIPLIRGRDFGSQDTADTEPVVVINEAFERQFFPQQDPVGQRLAVGGGRTVKTIVGVVGDIRQSGPRQPVRAAIYSPLSQFSWSSMSFVLKTRGEPAQLTPLLRDAVRRQDPQQSVYLVQTMETALAKDVMQDRATARLLFVFMIIAVILAGAGLYGIMSYSVAQRTQEFGIRIALGAARPQLLRMVLSQTLALAVLGLLAGFILFAFAHPILTPLLFGIEPVQPTLVGGITLLVLTITLVAGLLPARRALSIEPVLALKPDSSPSR